MIYYSQPHDFCWIVLQAIQAKYGKIKVTYRESIRGREIQTLAVGHCSATAYAAQAVLVTLCQDYARKYDLGIAYDPKVFEHTPKRAESFEGTHGTFHFPYEDGLMSDFFKKHSPYSAAKEREDVFENIYRKFQQGGGFAKGFNWGETD